MFGRFSLFRRGELVAVDIVEGFLSDLVCPVAMAVVQVQCCALLFCLSSCRRNSMVTTIVLLLHVCVVFNLNREDFRNIFLGRGGGGGGYEGHWGHDLGRSGLGRVCGGFCWRGC